MSERQAAYNAGPAHPTSVERLCDALELDYAPAVYSTPALFDKAVDKITALQYALEEAQRIAALRLTDCETMATEAEKYKAERDEARAWARKLWREKQAEKQCPACRGDGYVIVDIMGYSNGRMQKCFVCNGTGKVTK